MDDKPDHGYPQWVWLECYCGHWAKVCLPRGPYRLRDWILPRARCTKCGRKGAKDTLAARDPADEPPGNYPKF